MKRDSTCNVSIATEHPLMPEDANLKITYHPGKSGGTFGLPLGAKVLVAEGICGKKEWVTCQVASPAQRWRHTVSFPGEHVTSEIFSLTGNILKQQQSTSRSGGHSRTRRAPQEATRRSAILILPYYEPEGKHIELNVKGKWADQSSWVDVGFILKTDTPVPCVELEIERMGTFVVTYRRKVDAFCMTPNGGLFHSRLNRHISVRFPKRAVDSTISFSLEITPIAEDRLAFCKNYFTTDCNDLHHISDMFDLHPDNLDCNFRRFATIKLPLPEGVEVERDAGNDIVVLHKVGECWEWVDAKYKFTRNSVTFDVKNPNKFCVVKSKPDRQKKMQDAVTILEQRQDRLPGDVSLFLSIKDKSWLAVLECYPQDVCPSKTTTRQQQGFTVLQKLQVRQDPPPQSSFSFSSRRPPQPARSVKKVEPLEIMDGLTWKVEVSGEVQLTSDTDLHQNCHLEYFQFLRESYRQFNLQPATKEIKSILGTVTLTPVGVKDDDFRERLTLEFQVAIDEDAVREFLFVPEIVQEVPESDESEVEVVEAAPKKTVPAAFKKPTFTFTQTPMERLTQPLKRFNMPEREAKVLSGRSLMTLSKLLNNGVALAMELGLKESTVSGIGFDAMASTRNVSDVTYKILLYWKRTCKDKRDGAVQDLVAALRHTGKGSMADIVMERHRENKELTADCFLQAVVAGIDLST